MPTNTMKELALIGAGYWGKPARFNAIFPCIV